MIAEKLKRWESSHIDNFHSQIRIHKRQVLNMWVQGYFFILNSYSLLKLKNAFFKMWYKKQQNDESILFLKNLLILSLVELVGSH